MAKEQDILYLDEFKGWLDAKDFANPRSRNCIVSRLSKLNDSFLIHISTGAFKKDKATGVNVELSVWNILKSIAEDKHLPKLAYLDALMEAIMSRANDDKKLIEEETGRTSGTVVNYISAFNSYYSFISDKVKQTGYRETKKLEPEEVATETNITRGTITLNPQQLVTIFASRMNTQDRCSGDKVYLPLGLIGKILGKYSAPNSRIKNIHQWAVEEAKKVVIHTENKEYPVTSIKELRIDTASGEVYIIVSKGYRVYNPMEEGATQKTPMSLQRISQSDIDHAKEIDTILKEHGRELKGLALLTDWIKKAQKELGLEKIENGNLDEIYARIMSWKNIDMLVTAQLVEQILSDLETISKEHRLQLSGANWNRSTKKQAKKK